MKQLYRITDIGPLDAFYENLKDLKGMAFYVDKALRPSQWSEGFYAGCITLAEDVPYLYKADYRPGNGLFFAAIKFKKVKMQ